MYKTVYVYKLGHSYYDKNLDKNGGRFEANLIENSIRNSNQFQVVEDILTADIILSICGASDENDLDFISDSNKSKALKIFVQTDALLSKPKSLDIDYVLVQRTGSLSKDHQIYYSYVPELFYTYNYKVYSLALVDKIDSIIFGGALDGREEVVKRFSKCDNTLVIAKDKSSGLDNRLPYDKYIKLASMFRYHFICHEPILNLVGWVTPRIVEAVRLNCIPIVEPYYDFYNHFVGINSPIRLDEKEMWNFNNLDIDIYIEEFIKLRDQIERDQYKFLDVIDYLVNIGGK